MSTSQKFGAGSDQRDQFDQLNSDFSSDPRSAQYGNASDLSGQYAKRTSSNQGAAASKAAVGPGDTGEFLAAYQSSFAQTDQPQGKPAGQDTSAYLLGDDKTDAAKTSTALGSGAAGTTVMPGRQADNYASPYGASSYDSPYGQQYGQQNSYQQGSQQHGSQYGQQQPYGHAAQPAPTAMKGNPEGVAQAHKKRTRATWAIVVLSVLIVLVIAVVIFFALRAQNHMQNANAANEDLQQAISYVSASDQVLIPFDTVVNSSTSASNESEINKVTKDIPSALKQLDSAQESLKKAQERSEFLTDEQKEVLGYLQTSIDGRRTLFSSGQKYLQGGAKVSQLGSHINTAYASIVTADEKVREAIEAAKTYADTQSKNAEAALKAAESGNKKPTPEESSVTAQSVVDLDQAALDALNTAKTELDQAKSSTPELNIDSLTAYLEAKIAAVTILKDTDTAIASNSIKDAVEKVNSYNEADKKAVELAAAIPKKPEDLYQDLFLKSTQADKNTYDEARKKTALADSYIRKYQGIEIQGASGQPALSASVQPTTTTR